MIKTKRKFRKWTPEPPLHKLLNMKISKGVSRRARKLLKGQQLHEHEFVIWGGEKPHHVNYYEGVWTCDCEPYQLDSVNCSHIARAAMIQKGLASSEIYRG